MVTEFMENYRNEETGQSSLVLTKAQRLPWKKIMNLFDKNKAIKKYVVNSVPNSSASKKISFCIMSKPEFVEVNQLESLVQKVQGFISLLIMFMFSKQCEAKKTSQVSIVFHDEFVHVVQCYSIKCGSIAFRGQSYLLHVILN